MSDPVVPLHPPAPLRLVAAQAQPPGALVAGLQTQAPWAQTALVKEHERYVARVLTRILGRHSELEDLVQEVFARAFNKVSDIDDPTGLKSWLGAFAVNVARETLRRRRRWSWIVLSTSDTPPEALSPTAPPEVRAALRAFYKLLGKMDPEERIVFALRRIDGMELSEVAAICDVSLSTVKRRARRAEQWFSENASRDPLLVEWIGEDRHG